MNETLEENFFSSKVVDKRKILLKILDLCTFLMGEKPQVLDIQNPPCHKEKSYTSSAVLP